MKRRTMLQVPGAVESDNGFPTVMSAEDELHREIAKLGEWLAAQGADPRDQPACANDGGHDRLYWCYGYWVGLNKALAMLTRGGATMH